ncbi:M55 family metallopeptidase [Cytobacillus firmus]|jgi:D-amino peptidase|uniref:M55 family metallopeptidase n=1 Tax=Bacillaceae TaxID=186817 RepID=UPI00064EF2BA|nr:MULTISPECIES: M55 family metallopeptidase [Bacillaceae]KML44166.1 D-aminopeptidase [Cytobacillus firmus]MBG9446470.1 D-aminopeptidase [Cytobacillus firmus]MBG9587299.1 D-aminopeptidase [Cytobacillus firmus]MBY6054648.1 M55 family metallopeptidase [Cytobacillus firmus]MCC3649672.1 M55 family metallopeptidase [Cytobacillus oceanisediminis]
MKLYLSVDMEGITGLADHTHVGSSKHNYERSRVIMTDEANHVVTAAFEEGCSEVIVNDSHSKMNNLLIERMHPETQLITGDVKPYSMVQGLDSSFSGAIFVGYHARASMKGVMSHSMIFGVRHMYINDHAIGEMGFNAYVAGYHGVPILMVAGDDQAALEAEKLIPNVTTAVVKETISRSAVKSLTPAKAGQLLREKAAEALSKKELVKPLVPPENPVLKIEFANYGQAEWAALMPGAEIEENTTIVRYQAKDILEAYQAMLVMTELAMRTTFC